MPAKKPVTKQSAVKKSAETLVLEDTSMNVASIAPKVLVDPEPQAPLESLQPGPDAEPSAKRNASTPEAKFARRVQRRIAQAFALGMTREAVLEALDHLRAKIAQDNPLPAPRIVPGTLVEGDAS